MNHDDPLNPFTPNQRKIIQSTPPDTRARLDQAMAAHRDRLARRTPEEVAADETEWAEATAALDAWTPQDWAELQADLDETERRILRERGIDPE